MPAPEIAYRKQEALCWYLTWFDAYNNPLVAGQNQVSDPLIGSNATQLLVRWVDGQTNVLDPQGEMVTVDATAVVDREIPIGSLIWLGSLNDWYGTGSGSVSLETPEEQVMLVKTSRRTADLKARFTRRTVGLMRRRDTK